MKRVVALSTITLSALYLAACGSNSTQTAGESPDGDKDQLSVYATTGYLADAVANIAPDAKVTTMVGPGGDPHTYQPSTQDIQAIQNADLVFWNGLHLEAQMINQLESLGDKQLAVGDQIPTQMLLPWEDDLYDPHIWNSPEVWTIVVDDVAEKFAETDPENADTYRANAEAYNAKIEEVAQKAKEELAPVENRNLVTGHDAFNYFGKTFDFDVFATDFVSTEAAKSATEISELADFIVERQIKVIFQDNQANPQAIKALKEAVNDRGWEVEISDEELFADSLGPETPVNTYLGAFEHNAHAVAEALK